MEQSPQVGDQPNEELRESVVESENENNGEMSYGTYRRAVSERKRALSRVAELEDTVKEFERKELESKGKQDEVIKSLREELGKTKIELKETKAGYNWKTVQDQIKSFAVKSDCRDPEALVRLLDKNDYNAIQVDDKFNVNEDDVLRLIEVKKKQYSSIGLFGKNLPPVSDAGVSVNNNFTPNAPDMSGKSTSELLDELRKLDGL